MPLHEIFVLLLAAISYALWVRWLMKKTRAPKALCLAPAACAAVAAVTLVSAIWGLVSSFGALGSDGDSGQKVRALGDGVSLMMRSLQVGNYAVFAGGLSLLTLTWRYHWANAKAPRLNAP